MENKNIFTKLMEVRVKFHNLELKKSGLNKFAGFKYYELGDFLVAGTKLLQESNLCPIIAFTNEVATLTLYNGDNPSETIIFTSPMRELELKGTNAIQNLGGIQTYLTRYLYTQLLNIVEADVFDATSGKDDKKDNNKENGNTSNGSLTEKQINRLYGIAYGKGIKRNEVDELVLRTKRKAVGEMTKEEYEKAVEYYENLVKK